MSVHTSQKTSTSYRTVKVSSPEPVSSTVTNTVRSMGSVSGSVSPLQYSVNGYETLRYVVPQQQHQYVPVQQHQLLSLQQPQLIPVQQQQLIPVQQQQSYVVMQQPMMQQMVSPVYLQGLQHLSVSSQESDLLLQQQSTVEVSLG